MLLRETAWSAEVQPWRALKIPVGAVVTSMFQRAVDTGTLLGFGEVTSTMDVTEGGLVVTPDENNRRAQARIWRRRSSWSSRCRRGAGAALITIAPCTGRPSSPG